MHPVTSAQRRLRSPTPVDASHLRHIRLLVLKDLKVITFDLATRYFSPSSTLESSMLADEAGFAAIRHDPSLACMRAEFLSGSFFVSLTPTLPPPPPPKPCPTLFTPSWVSLRRLPKLRVRPLSLVLVVGTADLSLGLSAPTVRKAYLRKALKVRIETADLQRRETDEVVLSLDPSGPQNNNERGRRRGV